MPKDMQTSMPTAAAADAGLERILNRHPDANDLVYQFLASGDYNPEPDLDKIQCYLIAVNSADDKINPPEVAQEVMVPNIKRVRHGEYVLIPIGPGTHGHGTHTIAKVWKGDLARLLQESARAGD